MTRPASARRAASSTLHGADGVEGDAVDGRRRRCRSRRPWRRGGRWRRCPRPPGSGGPGPGRRPRPSRRRRARAGGCRAPARGGRRRARASTTCEPMKPDPPVTATVCFELDRFVTRRSSADRTASMTMSTSLVGHDRRHRQADVAGAQLLGARQRTVGPRLEHGLEVQRRVVHLAGQPDAVLLAQQLLELGPVDAVGQEGDVLVVVADARVGDGERASAAATASAVVVARGDVLAVGDELVEPAELAQRDGRVGLAHAPVVPESGVDVGEERRLALIAVDAGLVGDRARRW